jgi:hypothetical protein
MPMFPPSLPPPSPERRREFWQIPLRKKRSAKMVAEHANVPSFVASALAGATPGILANSATEETLRQNRSGTCQCSLLRCLRHRRTDAGEFWQIPLRKKRSAKIVAEHANVPCSTAAHHPLSEVPDFTLPGCLHRGMETQSGASRKLAISFSPASWLRSGWNCPAKVRPREMLEAKSSP